MTWEVYYGRFYNWADSTQITNISKLTSFGPSFEVCEIALALVDEIAATRLIKKALAAGVRFTSEEVIELDCCVDEELIPMLATTASTPFSADDYNEISYLLSKKDQKTVAKNSNLDLDKYNYAVSEQEKKERFICRMTRMPTSLSFIFFDEEE